MVYDTNQDRARPPGIFRRAKPEEVTRLRESAARKLVFRVLGRGEPVGREEWLQALTTEYHLMMRLMSGCKIRSKEKRIKHRQKRRSNWLTKRAGVRKTRTRAEKQARKCRRPKTAKNG
ncbi:hypothetical protein A2215_04365 [Candidatus Berkelbacteria bacterium RIFOXYA2_FULL_43_10]|uniref:Uncharacterized protein n=1 Tax=Candidatus Berkelbacteria bacterium RIFOXYA2_FULL_43_10 TaxID=1797472 RepID=A0A1F5EAM7_9BACT|nr:MAG: hypothetical protein A2215_04365 [Candidatus Berkelbacteria bacterium RIFOXYA2_FULL_43_10]